MNIILIGISAFAAAFLGCLQAINVVKGRKVMAAVTSFWIAASQLTLFKLVPNVEGMGSIIAFIVGGLAGSQVSMLVKRRGE
jgi:hypothetical protein